MSERREYRMRTQVVVETEDGRVLEVSMDQTGAYIHTPDCAASLPRAVFLEALERAGVTETRSGPVRGDPDGALGVVDPWQYEAVRRGLEVQSLRERLTVTEASCAEWQHRAKVAEAANARPLLDIDVIQQCLDGVLNDITGGKVIIRPDAEHFHKQAVTRLRSLAGVPPVEGQQSQS